MSAGETRFAGIAWRGRPVTIEYQWLAPGRRDAPLAVFLHEGLGSVAMWKDFPAQWCEALGLRGLVWSRPGYGRSTPRAADEHWANDFMHRQADEVLPAFLQAVGVREPPWLFGHSDGASIALLDVLRRWAWIPRRAECGTPCQTCRHRCSYQAITPAGQVQYADCFQCLDCVAIHQDAQQCLPLLQQARRVIPIEVAR